MKDKISLLGIIYSLPFLASLYQPRGFTDPFILSKHYFLMFTGVLSILVVMGFFWNRKYKLSYQVSIVDISIYSFLFYITLHLVLGGQRILENIEYLAFLVLGIIYALYKPILEKGTINNKPGIILNNIVWVIIGLGIVQALLGLGQYFHIIPQRQADFSISGTYGNPGPYANLLIVLLPFCFVYARAAASKVHKKIAAVATVLILIVLPFTLARASWVAALLLLVFVGFHFPMVIRWREKYFKTAISKILLVTATIVLFISGLHLLTTFKQNSSSGRLFIWKVSVDMIKDKPVFGHGFSRFPSTHNNYQADYFRANPDDWDNAYIADNVNYAFNEYIDYTTELGIVGLCLFLAIFYFIFRRKKATELSSSNALTIAAEASIIGVLACSLFSYPLHNVPVLAVLFFSLSVVSSANTKKYELFSTNSKKRRVMVFIALVVSVVFIKLMVKRVNAEKDWLILYGILQEERSERVLKVYDSLLPTLSYNQYFIYNYGAELTNTGKFKKSIEVLNQAQNRLNDSDFYTYQGANYEGIGQYAKAMHCYDQASNIMPITFYPRYRKVLLLQQVGKKDEAKKLAQKILEMPVKIDSEIVRSIKAEMAAFLQQSN